MIRPHGVWRWLTIDFGFLRPPICGPFEAPDVFRAAAVTGVLRAAPAEEEAGRLSRAAVERPAGVRPAALRDGADLRWAIGLPSGRTQRTLPVHGRDPDARV